MRRREFVAGVAPAVILMGGLLAVPLLYTVVWSFQKVSYGSPGQWVGFDNYLHALQDPMFHAAVGFTIGFALVDTALVLILGYALALLLNRARRGRSVFLGVLLVPYVIPAIISATAFSWLFDNNFGGLANYLLQKVTGTQVEWFTSTWANRSLILLEALWAGAPFFMLVFLGALKGVPQEQIEASSVDGANWWQRQRFVVIPWMAPMFRFLALTSLMGTLGLFDALVPLAPNAQTVGTQSVSLYVYQNAFARDEQNLGLGSAVNLLMLVVLFLLTAPFVRRMYREVKAS